MDSHLLRFQKNTRYTIIDCETFNLALNFRQNRIWQIGIALATGDTICSTEDIRINLKWSDAPYLSIGQGAAVITQFNENFHNQRAINHEEAFYKFWPLLKNCDYILGHNLLNFDIYLIKGYAEMMGENWKWVTNKIIDTNAIMKGIKLGIPFNKDKESFLEYQYKMLNIIKKGVKTNLKVSCADNNIEFDESKAHEACFDVIKTYELWNKLKWQIEI